MDYGENLAIEFVANILYHANCLIDLLYIFIKSYCNNFTFS
jgi:hypothetical protein